MAKFKVRLEWTIEEWYEVEASTEKEAYEQALDAPITNSKSLGIHLGQVFDSNEKLVTEFH